ncbi:hypothetical protein RhiLY_04433 [Ceratobasidium sp. AG-Ba]|nr:hypothetical protein RhiLY_04433 [Ceratobasidium sp. AG-Ba]
MPRKKQPESASQPLTKWFGSQRSAAKSSPAMATPVAGARLGATAEAESARKRQSAKSGPPALGPSVSFASTLTPLSSPVSSPVRRSDRLRGSTTPAPVAPPRPRVYQLQPIARMPPEIRCPSPDDSPYIPQRRSPPIFMKSFPDIDSSDTEEIPSSQKDDDEPMMEDDLATIEAMPIYHPSPPSSPSSEGLFTPAPVTPPPPPPRLLSPNSKTRHIIEEIRAKARLDLSSTSPPLKRPHSPTPDSDSDDLPDAGVLMGTYPAKRHKSATPSPNQLRRSTRISGPASRQPLFRSTAPPKPKPERNPFASIVREHAARAKRSESLPLAADGSRQNVLAIADAALMRDPDAAFEEELVGESSQLIDADEALDKLAEGGFAAEAEMVRRAGTTHAESSWTMFGPEDGTQARVLATFPGSVGEFMRAPFARRAWDMIAGWVDSEDYDSLSKFLGSTMLPRAFDDPQEREMLEPVIEWLVELVFLSPAHLSISESAANDVEVLVELLPSDAQDRIATHMAQCLLRIGPPGDGVRVARQVLGSSSDATHISSSKDHRRLLARLCASIMNRLTGAEELLPLLIVLCLMSIDPGLDSQTNLQIGKAIEAWVCKTEEPEAQLAVCIALAEALDDLSLQQKHNVVLRVFRGTRPAAGHMAMWLAICFLDGQGMENVTPAIYAQRPPLIRIFEYVETLHITSSTHYPDLLAAAQLLDITLWDIRALVDAERRAGRVIKYQDGVSPDSMVGDVSYMLQELHGKIVDARATDLEKTNTKAALQSLYIRVGWELNEAARRGQRPPGVVNTIKDMWAKPRPVRPTPKIL